MATATEQAIAALHAALIGVPGVLGVDRDRFDAVHVDEMPRIVVRREAANHEPWAAEMDQVTAAVLVDVYTAGTASPSADALHETAHQRITTNPALAALVAEVRCTSTEWTPESAEQSAGRLSCRYQLRLAVQARSLARAAN